MAFLQPFLNLLPLAFLFVKLSLANLQFKFISELLPQEFS